MKLEALEGTTPSPAGQKHLPLLANSFVVSIIQRAALFSSEIHSGQHTHNTALIHVPVFYMQTRTIVFMDAVSMIG